MGVGQLTLMVSELEIHEHIKWGTGVVFTSWPNEADMNEVMRQIRAALKSKSKTGNIYWHLSKTEQGWNISGNVAADDTLVVNPT